TGEPPLPVLCDRELNERLHLGVLEGSGDLFRRLAPVDLINQRVEQSPRSARKVRARVDGALCSLAPGRAAEHTLVTPAEAGAETTGPREDLHTDLAADVVARAVGARHDDLVGVPAGLDDKGAAALDLLATCVVSVVTQPWFLSQIKIGRLRFFRDRVLNRLPATAGDGFGFTRTAIGRRSATKSMNGTPVFDIRKVRHKRGSSISLLTSGECFQALRFGAYYVRPLLCSQNSFALQVRIDNFETVG